MRIYTYLILVCLVCQVQSQAQKEATSFILINAENIEANRYEDVKGSPYFFEDFIFAKIISRQLESDNRALVNYNSHTLNLELKQGHSLINLHESSYWRIEFHKADNPKLKLIEGKDKIVFQRNVHDRFRNRLVELVYEGDRLILIKDVATRISEVKIENVGKTERIKKFAHKEQFFVLVDGELSLLKSKKGSFYKAFSNNAPLYNFLKKEKINPNKEEDLIQFAQFYDELTSTIPLPHRN